jgi:enoyl-CoA hydratase/carnithine racemase
MKFLDIAPGDRDGIVHVTMKRGAVNAVDYSMYVEIAELFRNPDASCKSVRAIILSGAGRHFCGGNDLDEFASMTPANARERMWRVREAFFAIMECAVPVIGVVRGAALGTGLAIAASCDFVLAGEDALFGLPELTVGVMGGARHLARLAPQPLVRRMYFTGEAMPAWDFAAAGGAIKVCKGEGALAEAERLAGRIAGYSPTAVRVSKRVLDRIEWMDIREGYAFEQAATERMSGHPDSKEALAAFRERRDPSYLPLDRDAGWYGV